MLRDLTMVKVEPVPNAGRLMVTVAGPADATDPAISADYLARATGLLVSREAQRSVQASRSAPPRG